jgi:hypothetical protein
MKKLATIFILLFGAMSASAQTRFVAMDLIIDPKGDPLAAYQVEITAPVGVKIVGVEGGQHPEFRKAPYYDPKAIQSDRLIIAAFSTAAAAKLPTSATRVLTVHLECARTPKLEVTLKLAGDPRGQKISAEAQLSERK